MDLRQSRMLPDRSRQDRKSLSIVAETNREIVLPKELEISRHGFDIQYRSWVFRVVQRVVHFLDRGFGVFSMTILLAVAANLPIVQVLSFGYLLEVSGRVARHGKLRVGFPGLAQASTIGRGALGTAICLVPFFVVANFWYAAFLIDPDSWQTRVLRVAQYVLAGLVVPHILAAWFCGGRLRHFIWPLIAPISFGLWLVRRGLGSSRVRPILSMLFNWISPHLVHDLVNVRRLEHWFLPAVLWDHLRRGTLWVSARDRFWDYLASWRLWSLARLGVLGFFGTALWLTFPTALLLVATVRESPANALLAVLGLLASTIVFTMLFVTQTQYAATGDFAAFFKLIEAYRRVAKAPFAFFLAALISVLMAMPLFLAKIEEIPSELLWVLSLFFVTASWIERLALGWAYARSSRVARTKPFWWSWPWLVLLMFISFAYAFALFFSRYLSWNGAWSTIENSVFLLPAPFWL